MRKRAFNILKIVWLAIPLLAVEFLVRLQPEMRELHITVLDAVPFLYNFCYVFIFVTISVLLEEMGRKKRLPIGKIFYEAVYALFCVFFLAEYVYCAIFGRVFSLKEVSYAGEGLQYIGTAFQFLDVRFPLLILCCLILGAASWRLFPRLGQWKPLKVILCLGAAASLAAILVIPSFFKPMDEDDWYSKNVIYENWSHNKRAVAMFGGYEYFFRDLRLSFQKNEPTQEELDEIETYLSSKERSENEMTGLFEGKNLILVLMESVDDWLVTPEDTPTIYRLMSEGINFSQMYTPIFGIAYTLNSEFSSYTGLYASADGVQLINCANNSFPDALPFLFRGKGYTAVSYHYNSGDFYNRFNLHHSVGFEKYVSFLDYLPDRQAQLDTALADCDEIYQQFIEKEPFFNYVITYTAHAQSEDWLYPYSYDDPAFDVYPELKGKRETEELDAIWTKVKVTDDMFADLLERLDEDGLLEDTVIIGFADHYAYAFPDRDYVYAASKVDNEYELSRNPFFIWTPGIKSETVEKVCNTSDIYPTICNLFDLEPEVPPLGEDIFDPDYQGYAYWPDRSWMTDEGAYYADSDQLTGDMDDGSVQEMKELIAERIKVNDDILSSDYFSMKEN